MKDLDKKKKTEGSTKKNSGTAKEEDRDEAFKGFKGVDAE